MNKKVQKAWADALRSGDYEQGKGMLHSGDTYCCLGVLCELAVEAGVTERFNGPRVMGEHGTLPSYKYGPDSEVANTGTLPIEVSEWAGLKGADWQDNPTVDGYSLATWNDHKNADFNDIARLVEKL